jgi:hypothetical protein
MAEARGYQARIEEPIPNGKGLVDVSLERNGRKIACEIGITTSKEWEVHNVEKCLSAGYDLVVAISNEKRGVDLMQRQISEKLDTLAQAKILVMEPEQLFLYLDTQTAKEATTETRIKGYRVKVEYNPASLENAQRTNDSVTKVVRDSIKRNRK